MKYEVWEYEYGVRYGLFEVGNPHEREVAASEGARCVLTFSATSWRRAKTKSNEYIKAIRGELLKNDIPQK